MRGIDKSLIRQRQKFVVNRVVEMLAELLCRPSKRGTQVRPADIADKKRVSGENGVRRVDVLRKIEDEDGDGLDGVARGLKNLETEPGEVERSAVVHGDELV